MTDTNCQHTRKLPAWMMKPVFEEEEKPLLTFQGQVKYCSNINDMCLACEDLISLAESNEELLLGFDAEWPVFSRGPGKIALFQVCLDKSLCFLFHVGLMQLQSLPKIFIDLIKHSNIKLVGNCIRNDIWKLGKDFGIPVAKLISSGRIVDLSEYANRLLNSGQTWSLERLAIHVLSARIDKSPSVRLSQWDDELSQHQKLYAATDAYVSLLIYHTLTTKNNQQLD